MENKKLELEMALFMQKTHKLFTTFNEDLRKVELRQGAIMERLGVIEDIIQDKQETNKYEQQKEDIKEIIKNVDCALSNMLGGVTIKVSKNGDCSPITKEE